MKKQQFTAIDVFSGCGGMTTGLKSAGFRVLGAVELNEHANLVYSLNHPEVKIFPGDIRKLSVPQILQALGIKPGELSLLAGCPPCQGYSRMRTKNRIKPVKDPRNKLIFDFVRLAEGLLPKTIMLENVPNLKKDWRLKKSIKRLEALGYQCDCQVVNAVDYGVPQRRKRMILVASRVGSVSVPKVSIKHHTVRQTIGELPIPQKSRKPLHRLIAVHEHEIIVRIKRVPKNGGSRSAWGDEEQLACHKRLKGGFKDVYGRMSWDKPAPTMTRSCINPSKGRFLHPEQDREISLFEASLLQSFPRSYEFPISLGRGEIASMIGEALPPLLAKKQAVYLIKHLGSANE